MKSSSLSLSSPVVPVADAGSSPASWGSLVASSVRAAVAVMLVAGIAYPLATTGVAQALLPHAASGSLIERNGQVVGSALIGQQFAGGSYFHGRPSATTAPDPAKEGASLAAPYNAGLSGGSNQGATHQDLAETVAARVAQYRADNGLAADAPVPVDAVTASASGLDPHISVANAMLQLPRVAQARKLSQDQVRQLLERSTQARTLGLLGEPRVNVLRLNLALDALRSAAKE
ncbi:potassium-transporting ATPase KdpC subunit [Comamonas phosphati]|nr:potassium-transporting ATPase KdpC subunit [Comamonas phosphati]